MPEMLEQFKDPGVRNKSYFLLVISLIFIIMSFYNFMFFHVIVELFSVFVAYSIFILVFYSRDRIDNDYLLFLGVAFLFIGSFDLIHTLVYKGMNIFSYNKANLATQLWIISRYIEGFSLLTAAYLVGKESRLNFKKLFNIYLFLSFILGLSIYLGIFPDSYLEGIGLTTFKKTSEYIIAFILFLTILMLYKNKKHLSQGIYSLMLISITVTIASEISFTFYNSVYGIANIIGHILKFISFYLIYEIMLKKIITEPQKMLFEKLEYLSFHDELTGLFNRRYFENELQRLNQSRRYPITVIVGDLDNLKLINDNIGHKAGDEYIKNAALSFNNTLRKEDIAARIGGDEIAAVLPETDSEAAADICSRIRENFADYYYHNQENNDGFYRISIGFQTVDNHSDDLNDAFDKADKKMYKNKNNAKKNLDLKQRI